MQHDFCQLAQRLSVEFPVQLLKLAVFMAETPGHRRIPPIQALDARLADVVGIVFEVPRLPAAANAAAGAGHDLNEMIGLFAFPHPLDHPAGVGGAVDHRHIHGQAVDGKAGFPDALIPANRLQVQQFLRRVFSGDEEIGGAQCGLHHAAGVAENHAGAGALAEHAVELRGLDILQLDQQKMRLSAAMLTALQESFEEYGLVVTEFLVMGIMLPQRGDLGYDALQTILEMRQKDLTKSAIATETELKLAEMEAKKQLDIRIQENVAEVEIAHRKAVAQKGETSVLEAQYASQRKVAEATGDVQAERLHMQLEMERKAQTAQIEAEEMRLKGYTQRDVLQTDVQKAYAGALGQMGANGGGSGSGMLGDIAGLGVTLGAMGSVIGMTKDAMAPMMNLGATMAAPAAADGWDCACGAKNIQSRFCPECGAKKPEPKTGWDCPECGTKNIQSKFCPECGARKPEPKTGWDCPECGTKNILSKFCPECGHKRGE